MSRIGRTAAKNAPLPPTAADNNPEPSSSLATGSRPLTRTRTVSTNSTRPPSRLAQIHQARNPNTATHKRSSTPKPASQHPQHVPSQPDPQEHPPDPHPPGANIKVVVRCRGLTDLERASDPQVVLLTGGVRGRELTVDLNTQPTQPNTRDGPGTAGAPADGNPIKDEQVPVGTSTGLSNTHYSSSLVDDPKRSANIKIYPFDHVFGPEADQALIFTDVVSPILTEVLQGYNCTIFAYGQTGTGKTYTMTGDLSIPTATTIMPTTKGPTDSASLTSPTFDATPLVIPTSLRKYTNEAGIIPRVLHSLFNMLEDCSEEEKVEFGVKVSFVELYNEELRDLNYLESSASDANPPSGSTNLKIFEDASHKKGTAGGSGVYIQNLTETPIASATEGIKILTLGSSRRQIAATRCNEQSSRSHSVFSITIHVKESTKDGKEDQLKIGKLNLVDLAGSENVGRSGAGKEFGRAREAGMINQSLLTLGRVINALVEKNSHVPYRESKLTRLLQDSLGGKTKTCIIATVSPSRLNLEETISTLDYALRAKSIKNRPELNNKINKAVLINQYITEIEKLRHDLIATRTKNGIYFNEERWAELMKESEYKSRTLIDSKRKIELIELELIGVKKEFEKCLRILNVRETEVKKVQDDLSRKNSEFEEMKRIKEGLEVELSEERKRREGFEKSRTKWKNQCKEVFEDNEGLRAKIARKVAVESFNQNTLKEVDQSLNLSSQDLKHGLKEFGADSNQLSRSAKNCLRDMEQRLVKSMKSTQNQVQVEIQSDLNQMLSALSDSIEAAKSHASSFISTIQSDLIPNGLVKETQIDLADIQERETERLSSIQEKLSQMQAEALGMVERTKSCVQNSFEIIQDKFKQDREQLIKLHQSEKAELREETLRLKDDIEALKQHTLEDERQVQQDERELIELIQRQHASSLKRKLNQTDLLVKSLSELKERKERKKMRFSGIEKEFDAGLGELNSQLDSQLGSARETLEGFETSFQEGQLGLSDQLIADRTDRLSSYNSHRHKIEALGTNMQTNCVDFLKDFGDTAEELELGAAKVAEQVGSHHAQVSSQIGTQIATVEGSVRSVLEDVERQSSLANTCIDKSLGLITSLRNEVHGYLTHEIRQDTNTGQTPRRRDLPVEPATVEQSRTVAIRVSASESGETGESETEESTSSPPPAHNVPQKKIDSMNQSENQRESSESAGEETVVAKLVRKKRAIPAAHLGSVGLPVLVRSRSRSNGILRDKGNQSIGNGVNRN